MNCCGDSLIFQQSLIANEHVLCDVTVLLVGESSSRRAWHHDSIPFLEKSGKKPDVEALARDDWNSYVMGLKPQFLIRSMMMSSISPAEKAIREISILE